MRRRRKVARTKSKNIFPLKIDELKKTLEDKFENNPDLMVKTYQKKDKQVAIFYIDYLVNTDKLETSLLNPIIELKGDTTNENILNNIPLMNGTETTSLEKVLDGIIIGEVYVYIEDENSAFSYQLHNKETRSLDKAETESLVLGPKVAFTESLEMNLNIVRWRIKSSDLVLEEVKVGKLNPRDVRIVYMKSIANETDVNTLKQRILDLDVDEIEDSVLLKQYLEDNQNSPFPQFDLTELPDRFTYGVTRGKVGVLVEDSPTGFLGPSSLFSFLESTEDLYMRWETGTFLRVLRMLSTIVSIILTPIYVALVSYHYPVIPMQLLISIGQSRASVPFPPFIEAIILELIIELLREAGARLPTKVGQTIGVVGGIVIGQASVQAGLTSNILIIIVAISALASFTSPSYLLSTTIRMIRFPFIIASAFLGLFGLMFGLCLLLIHLLRLTSLGRPYLTPLYPLQLKDFNKTFYRTPLKDNYSRSKSYRPKFSFRFSKDEAAKKRDIDK